MVKENNIDAYKNKLCVSKATLTETCQVFRTNKRVNFYLHTELGGHLVEFCVNGNSFQAKYEYQ